MAVGRIPPLGLCKACPCTPLGPLQGLALYVVGGAPTWLDYGLDYGLRLPAGPSPSRRGGVGLTSVGESPLFPWDPPVAACGLPPSPLPRGRMTRLTLLLGGRCNDTHTTTAASSVETARCGPTLFFTAQLPAQRCVPPERLLSHAPVLKNK